MSQGKTIGIILAGIGLAILVLAAAWGLSNDALPNSAKVLAIVFGFVVAAPLLGFGIYTFTKGTAEAGEEKVIAKQRKLLNMVMTQGKVNIAEASLELQTTRDQTKQLIYDVIGKQLFTGYVNWDKGMLYSTDAAKLKDTSKCPNCGGQLELAGKGLIKCPFCGSEIFTT